MDSFRLILILAVLLSSCQREEKLPILGETFLDARTGGILYYQAPEFQLTNQLNEVVHSDMFKGKIQVVDFFFTSCPTICPKMTQHLKLVEDTYQDEGRVFILSYSIDPQNDTPEKLKEYADANGINSDQWKLLTGNGDDIFELSKDYKVRAFEDDGLPVKNLIHDGTFVLVDGEQRIRGYDNGLDEEDADKLIHDIQRLLKE